jgi:hypothetical protein
MCFADEFDARGTQRRFAARRKLFGLHCGATAAEDDQTVD